MKRRNDNSRGFITILVLCIVIAISILLTGFTSRISGLVRSSEHLRYAMQAVANARAGMHLALAAINKDPDSPKISPDPGRSEFRFDSVTCNVNIEAEHGKINANSLLDRRGNPDHAVMAQLARLITNLNTEEKTAIDLAIIPAIIDWIDSDDAATRFIWQGNAHDGAESDHYLARKPQYRPRNSRIESLSELLYIRGISPETLAALGPFITVYGSGTIDINTAPPHVLRSLSESITPAMAEEIIARRSIAPFQSLQQLKEIAGLTDTIIAEMRERVAFRPAGRTYTIRSAGSFNGITRTVTAVVSIKGAGNNASLEIVHYDEL